jgi:hypothetical protein
MTGRVYASLAVAVFLSVTSAGCSRSPERKPSPVPTASQAPALESIGQEDADEALPDAVSWDEDGSYFGHHVGDRQPRIRWSKLIVGRVDAKGNAVELKPWGVAQSNLTFRAGMLNYPNNPKNISFTCTACPDESNAINLASGRP